MDLMGTIVTGLAVFGVIALVLLWCVLTISARADEEADQVIADWSKRRHDDDSLR